MRSFAHSFEPSTIYQITSSSQESYAAAIAAACDVLEVDTHKDIESLTPAEMRAIEGLTTFFRSGRGSIGLNRAYTVINLNTGKSVLFLDLHVDYNGEF